VSYFAAPVFLAAVGWLVHQRRWQALTVLLIASPFSVASASATLSYARGRKKMHYPTRAEVTALSRPVRFHPAKWLGWFCAMLVLGSLILSFLLEHSGGYIGPAESWVQEFLKKNSRRF